MPTQTTKDFLVDLEGKAKETGKLHTTIMLGVVLCVLFYSSSIGAEHHDIEAKGIWIEGAAGIQSSGIIPSDRDSFWIIGDQNTNLDGTRTQKRVFKIILDAQSEVASAEGENGIVVRWGDQEYNGDFEGICRQSGSTSIFAVTEQKVAWNGETEPSVFEFDKSGELLQRRSEINLNNWVNGGNKKLEGVACGDHEIFLAFEEPPKILWMTYEESRMGVNARAKNDKAILPRDLNVEFGQVKNINGLHHIKDGNREYLLAISRDDSQLLTIEITRPKCDEITGEIARVTKIKFLSPDNGSELCWASPEGITVSGEPGRERVWIVNDPAHDPGHRHNYRELQPGEARLDDEERSCTKLDRRPQKFEDFVPMLFSIPLTAVLPGDQS